jgi:protein involved in polysaccharide export with SLBB domain
MRRNCRLIAFLIIICFIGQVAAIDVGALGLNIPNIQGVGAAEKAGPQTTGDIALEYPIDENTYKLGPGDTLSVNIIVGESDLSIGHNLFIGADGKTFFPNIGELYLSGLSLAQAKEKLNLKIKSVYAEPYNIYVLLKQPKKIKIYLSGMVKSPGPLTVYDNMRISEVLSLAGGIASGGSNRYVYIKRKGVAGKQEILTADIFEAYRSRDLSKDIRIQAGDVVEVPDSQNDRISQMQGGGTNDKLLFEGKETFVYVYGEVAKSGRFEYVPGRRLSDYISFAGGPTGKALLGSVSITRQINNKPEKYTINVSDLLYNGNSRNDVEIFGGDVINIPGNFFYVTDFTSFVNTILLTLTLFNTVRR